MHLTLHTDYALRVLLYLAHYPGRRVSTAEISSGFGISKHHLVRVVQSLTEHQFVTATMGRGGGLALRTAPDKIRIGDVVRACEPNFKIVECFEMESNTCPIVPVCGLKFPLNEALQQFLKTLDGYTLVDIGGTTKQAWFVKLLLPH